MSDKNPTLKLFQTIGVYSPLIVIIGVWIVAIFANAMLKGITYLFLIIFALTLRIVAFKCIEKAPTDASVLPSSAPLDKQFCSMQTGIIGDNETLGAYVISFTMWYVCLPMFLINDINWGVFSFFLFTLIFNLLINKNCIKTCVSAVATNVIASGLLGAMFSLGVYTYANSLSLVNQTSSNAEVCTAPSKQTFKCKVYKNGELVNEVST